jgi:hypothetical protein
MIERNYGMTQEEWANMRARQQDRCAICREPAPILVAKNGKVRDGLTVDHDHTTGEIRGLLCGACNAGIARFKHDTKVIRAGIRYLLKHRVPADGLDR